MFTAPFCLHDFLPPVDSPAQTPAGVGVVGGSGGGETHYAAWILLTLAAATLPLLPIPEAIAACRRCYRRQARNGALLCADVTEAVAGVVVHSTRRLADLIYHDDGDARISKIVDEIRPDQDAVDRPVKVSDVVFRPGQVLHSVGDGCCVPTTPDPKEVSPPSIAQQKKASVLTLTTSFDDKVMPMEAWPMPTEYVPYQDIIAPEKTPAITAESIRLPKMAGLRRGQICDVRGQPHIARKAVGWINSAIECDGEIPEWGAD